MTGKASDTVAMAKKFAKNGDEIIDATKVADKVDDVYDATKTAGKVDDIQEINKLLNMDKLPKDSSELAGLGWKEITPEGMRTHTTSKMYEKDGMKIVFDEATPNAEGFGGKNHYHVLNPNSTSKHDYYLDRNGNPVPKNSKQSHIIP